MGGEEKIDFFPQWKPPQGVVEEEEEEEEQYMTIDEDGRPYIAVRRKLRDKQEKEGQEWRPMQGVVEENKEEEEQYMTIGEDGRPYIAVRTRQRQDNRDSNGLQMSRHTEEERNEVEEEEEITKIEEEEEDKEMKDLFREYQENAKPNAETLQVLIKTLWRRRLETR